MTRDAADIICPTFDDGPDPVWTPRILDALAEADARATFFVVAPLATARPRLIERMLSGGHEVALHCERHVRHTRMTDGEVLTDARRGLESLATLGVEPTRWRTPWGVVTAGTERAADEFGLHVTPWTSDTHDWRGDTAGEMLRNVAPELSGGSVVLMHDGLGPGARRDGCEETLALVPLLAELAGRMCLRMDTVASLHGPGGPARVSKGGRLSTV